MQWKYLEGNLYLARIQRRYLQELEKLLDLAVVVEAFLVAPAAFPSTPPSVEQIQV